MPTFYYLALSFALFLIGTTGVLLRRNALIVLMGIELQLNAGNLAMLAYSRQLGDEKGHAFAFLIIALARVPVWDATAAILSCPAASASRASSTGWGCCACNDSIVPTTVPSACPTASAARSTASLPLRLRFAIQPPKHQTARVYLWARCNPLCTAGDISASRPRNPDARHGAQVPRTLSSIRNTTPHHWDPRAWWLATPETAAAAFPHVDCNSAIPRHVQKRTVSVPRSLVG